MDGDADAAAGGIIGPTKPAGLTQPSSSSLFSGFGPTPAGQNPSAVSFPNLQTPQQGTSNILGAAPSSFGQQNAFGLQQPTQNVVSVPSTPVTNPFGTLPAMPQIAIGRSAGSGPASVQHRISNMPVSFFSDGDDAPSTPSTLKAADMMSIPSSSYDQSPTSSCSLPSYLYKPLDIGRNEIRLIKLQAPIKSQPLCGKIIHVPLTAESHYWALSYCWGSLAGKRTIILDGMELQITVNLDDALRQLGDSYGMLWVDAICINQEDIPERSREVLRMDEIYSLASGVVTWLGVATKTSDKAMDFLRVFETKEPRSQYDEYLKELPLENDLGKFGDEWIALKDLVMNGYWSRTWIIQELTLNRRSKMIHCGTKSLSLSWDNFKNVFGSSFEACIRYAISNLQEHPKVASGIINIGMLINFGLLPGFYDAHVFGILLLTKKFLVTDPRDKVYGILALSADLRQLVPHPNYANSKGVVFRDLTKAMLASGHNLALICFKHPTYVNQSDVVSWAPDWDVRGEWVESPNFLMQVLLHNHSKDGYSTDAGKDAIISYVGGGSILRVRGISFDRVDGLGSTEVPGSQPSTKGDHNQNAYGSDVDTFRALKELSQETFHDMNPGAPQDVNNECLITRVYEQLAFGGPNSLRTSRFSLSKTREVWQWLHRLKELSFVGISLLYWFERAYTNGQALPSEPPPLDPELDGMLQSVHHVTCDGWRWLSTDRGYLGRTHPQTQKGDEIVIVQGCPVPMVLRPCGPHYIVVGAAYVQGIMHGEALQGVTDDQMRYFDLA